MASFPLTSMALTGAILFTGEEFVENHALLVKDGTVLDIVPEAGVPAAFEKKACGGGILAPGFIDCQVNGGGNVYFTGEPTEEAVLKIAAAHRKTGTTALLPTLITAAPETVRRGIEAVRAAHAKDTSILGIHIEGPHIAPERKGAHAASLIRPLTDADSEHYAPKDGEIVLVTLAPENAGAEQIARLVEKGTIVSLGHTAAGPEVLRAALTAGARGFTHLFNGMGPIGPRDPGPAGVALDDRDSFCGLVGDGVHLAPETMRLALRAKPEDRLFFVSDAMAPAGADKPEIFSLDGDKIEVKDGACRREDGALVGAALTLGEIVSKAIRDMKMAPERALRMASAIPAAFLGLDKTHGKLLPGFRADGVLLDHFFRAKEVFSSNGAQPLT